MILAQKNGPRNFKYHTIQSSFNFVLAAKLNISTNVILLSQTTVKCFRFLTFLDMGNIYMTIRYMINDDYDIMIQ